MNTRSVISSLAYKFIERLLVKGLGLIISVILARMLAPEDFGLIAIITVFINLSQTIVQSGLNTALIQNQDVTEDDYSTVFYISLILSIIMFAILYLSAPLIGFFYNSNSLVRPLRIYAISLVFGAFNSVQVARMQKKMQFKAMMVCTTIATIASGALGVFLAYLNAGIWALIAYYLASILFTCITMMAVEKWVPRVVFSKKRAKILFKFGWKMLVSSLLCSFYNDLRSLVIGKKYSTEDLGYYNRGQQFPNIISCTIDDTIQSVMFPTLATVQDSKTTIKHILRRFMSTGTFLVFPIMFGLAAVGDTFIRLLLTDKWTPCVVYMQILCFAGAAIPIVSSNLIAIKAIGRSDIYMKLELIRRVVMIVILAISIFCFDSVVAIAKGYVISAWIDVIIVSIPISKLIGYKLLEQIKDQWKTMFASAIMFIVVFLMNEIPLQMIIRLLIQVVVGGLIYLFFCKVLHSEGYEFVKGAIIGLIKQ